MIQERVEWDGFLESVIYTYRCRNSNDRRPPFEIENGETPQFPGQQSINMLQISVKKNSRLYEIKMATSEHSGVMALRLTVDSEPRFEAGDNYF